ncbi:OmpA family protein [Plastoroseomonas arctica]|uniref:OmpA-like domain-containing protein n=1 Tax=Plastoroseomonas arctica TaxID=1509237 RepID=A0AAF1JZW3_9PROT|nr:hypothetical protein [Plastoroseomonas arctica]MBR0657205.1 hypothetical protein [Plastoroseomonas arctica]
MMLGLKLLRVGGILAALCLTVSDSRHAQALSRSYICFDFDLESAELPPRCLQIVSEFAAWWRQERDRLSHPSLSSWDREASVPLPAQEVRVELVGHSLRERDGNNLAFLRAARIGRELERLGVPADLISLSGRVNLPMGFDAVNFGMNRRVEFVLR